MNRLLWFWDVIEIFRVINNYRNNVLKLSLFGDGVQMAPVAKSKSGHHFSGGEFSFL